MRDQYIWELEGVKTEIKRLQDEMKPLEQARAVLEEKIIEEMSDSGLSLARTEDAATGKRLTISVSSEDMANVTDWGELEEFIYENRALYLLQRRPSNGPYRELVATLGKVPGVETFTKKRLSLRHVK